MDEKEINEKLFKIINTPAPAYPQERGYLKAFKKQVASRKRPMSKQSRRKPMGDWKHTCPICKYDFENCQCRFAGAAHPDRSIRIRAVLDHLQYLCDEQIAHIQNVEEWWSTSGKGEYQEVVEELKEKYNDFCSNGGEG